MRTFAVIAVAASLVLATPPATAQSRANGPFGAGADLLEYLLHHHKGHKDVAAKPETVESSGDPATDAPEPGAAMHFTGETIATEAVIQDVVPYILAIAADQLHCQTPDGFRAEILPASYVPADKPEFAAHPSVSYERWTLSLCGRSAAFLLAFWPGPGDKGTAFGVGYPFSPDARHP